MTRLATALAIGLVAFVAACSDDSSPTGPSSGGQQPYSDWELAVDGAGINGVWTLDDQWWLVGDFIRHWDGQRLRLVEAPVTSDLRDVWGWSSRALVAVGDDGLALHFDGDAWRSRPTHTNTDLLAVWGSGPGDVFAVGADGSVLHFDGTGWLTMVGVPGTPLRDIYGVTGDRVWAVGADGLVLRWDGEAWDTLPAPTTDWLNGVWAFAGEDVYVISNTTLYRWSGTDWQPHALPAGTTWTGGIWGTAPDDLTIIGAAGDQGLFHFDGQDVTALPVDGAVPLYAGHADVVAGAGGRILRFDGASWTTVAAGDLTQGIAKLHGRAADDIYAVTGGSPSLLHYDGLAWRGVPGAPAQLSGLWCADGVVFACAYDRTDQALRLSGGVWQTDDLAADFNATDVWAASATSAYLVGSGGGIYHWNGATWAPMTSPTSRQLDVVFGFDDGAVFAAGEQGTILHWDGVEWHDISLPGTDAPIAGLWGASPDDLYAGGWYGRIHHWNGQAWTLAHEEDVLSFYNIWGQDPQDITFTATDGVYHWNGVTYRSLPLPTSLAFISVWSDPAGTLYVGSREGAILKLKQN